MNSMHRSFEGVHTEIVFVSVGNAVAVVPQLQMDHFMFLVVMLAKWPMIVNSRTHNLRTTIGLFRSGRRNLR
jgi:hypothetical protein